MDRERGKALLERFNDELLQRLTESCGACSRQVRIDIRSTDVKLPINEAIPCGLIVNELVSNALKHGFPDDQSGKVLVDTRWHGSSMRRSPVSS